MAVLNKYIFDFYQRAWWSTSLMIMFCSWWKVYSVMESHRWWWWWRFSMMMILMTIDNDDDDDDDDDKLVVREALFSVVSEQCREMSVGVQSEHCAREQYLIPMHCKLYISSWKYEAQAGLSWWIVGRLRFSTGRLLTSCFASATLSSKETWSKI